MAAKGRRSALKRILKSDRSKKVVETNDENVKWCSDEFASSHTSSTYQLAKSSKIELYNAITPEMPSNIQTCVKEV